MKLINNKNTVPLSNMFMLGFIIFNVHARTNSDDIKGNSKVTIRTVGIFNSTIWD